MIYVALIVLVFGAHAGELDLWCTGAPGEQCINVAGTEGRPVWTEGSTRMQYCVATQKAWALVDAGIVEFENLGRVCWGLNSPARDTSISPAPGADAVPMSDHPPPAAVPMSHSVAAPARSSRALHLH